LFQTSVIHNSLRGLFMNGASSGMLCQSHRYELGLGLHYVVRCLRFHKDLFYRNDIKCILFKSDRYMNRDYKNDLPQIVC
jgi:hypothetical protein